MGCVFGDEAGEARLRRFAHVQRRGRERTVWVGGRRPWRRSREEIDGGILDVCMRISPGYS